MPTHAIHPEDAELIKFAGERIAELTVKESRMRMVLYEAIGTFHTPFHSLYGSEHCGAEPCECISRHIKAHLIEEKLLDPQELPLEILEVYRSYRQEHPFRPL